MPDFAPFSFILASADTQLALAMLLVFGAAKITAEIFERLGLQGIVGEIIAGVILGPSVLNWIQPSELLTTLSDLGVMFLLFRVGLEVKASELMKVGGTAFIVACTGVIVPFLFGWGILLLWGRPQIEAIFVGASMVATSVGITAQVLASKGLLHQVSARIILAAAVIDDVLGLLVLAVVSSVARGKVNFLELGITFGLAAGFVVIAAKWGSQAMGHVVPRVQRNLRIQEAEFTMALIMLFALALLASYAGVAAIVGAFMAGMALSESVGQRVQDLTHGASELLLPFFLAGIGLHVDLRSFADPKILGLALIIIVAAVVSKYIGCGLGALRLGYVEATRIGVGMIPRGEVGMVVAQIGLGMGVISQPVYVVVVGMAVATTIMAPPLLSWAYKGAAHEEPVEEFRLG